MLKKLADRVLYRDSRHYAAFPALVVSRDGDILVLFRRARDHRWLGRGVAGADAAALDRVDHVDPRSHLALLRLSADLTPRGEPEILPPDIEAADQDANLLVLRDGRLLQAGFGWYPFPPGHADTIRGWGGGWIGSTEDTGCLFLFWGGYTRLSVDGGRSWSPRRWLPGLPGHADLVPGKRPLHGGAVRGRAVEAADGTILLATYATHPKAGGRHACHLFASPDGGEAWEYRSLIALDADGDAGYVEPSLHLAADGLLTAYVRTFALKDRLVTVVSRDLGRTWSAPRLHEGIKGHPWDVTDLPDGRRLAVCGWRHDPCGIRGWLWDPATQEIDQAAPVVIRDDAPTRDVGYPWAAVLPDGRLAVAYYFCDGEGVRHVAASLLSLDP
ncbi:exo-alpha-sialidase [Azospirillum sp.]|uniref:exo-alpha-sialidase n=1 Tax=Azospirillum sp. TaxID=34012 RepID=UPI002D279B1A|nr:exo-alpha-sialidase [Azospirillum sp.]HYD70475.1 exo-alpha-sialidase [Azospirillum sp.]